MLKDFASRSRNYLRHLGAGRIQGNIVFLHSPKCGGTSLASAIRQHYIGLDPRGDRLIGRLDTFAAYKAATLLGQPPVEYNRDMLLYFLAQDYRYVHGHFSFHEDAFDGFKEKYAFVTMLREPVKKWLSLYFYNRYKAGDHYRISADLERFLETPDAVQYGCGYALQFAGRKPDEPCTSQTTIDRAIDNLQRFHLVGILERMPRFLADFEQRFGAKLRIGQMRRSPVSPEARGEIVTPEIAARVEELCRPNLAIYDVVRSRLDAHP